LAENTMKRLAIGMLIYIYINSAHILLFTEILQHLCQCRMPEHATYHNSNLHTVYPEHKIYGDLHNQVDSHKEILIVRGRPQRVQGGVCQYDRPIRSMNSSVQTDCHSCMERFTSHKLLFISSLPQ
jgi:hypothetical protein